jgi:uncharacterized damage-inducible protein DinB
VSDKALRDHVAALIGWEDAHAGLDRIVEGVPADKWGAAAPGLPYTLWQLLEHLRLTQYDILDFCRNPGYKELAWPADYWPPYAAPPTDKAWDESIAAVRRDRAALGELADDLSVDVFARIPYGAGQTYLRELLLVADHNAYHVGQLVAVRQSLDAWK